MRAIVTGVLVLLAPGFAAQAQELPGGGSAQGDVSVTIYNNEVALVQDVRTLAIGSGRVSQSFPDVSARIGPRRSRLRLPMPRSSSRTSTSTCSRPPA